MKNQAQSIRFLFATVLLFGLAVSGCGAGQVFGPTLTPTPSVTLTPTLTSTPTSTSTPAPTSTPTPTSTPIPGIGAPLTIGGVGVQLKSAVLGGEPTTFGFTLKPGYTNLAVEIALSGGDSPADLLTKIAFKQVLIVDENGNTSGSYSFSIPIDSFGAGSQPVSVSLYFAVKADANVFSLRFTNGQAIELAPILKKKG